MKDAKIFLSWSGERSHLFAKALYDWFPKVIQSLKPWLSSSDIDKGDQWLSKISEQLKKNNFGIICLTSENISAPWLLFEAGALSSAIDQSNVCPILFDFEPSLLTGPLAQFQATQFLKTDILELMKTINNKLECQKIPEDTLIETFNVWWPKIKDKIDKIPKTSEKKPERTEKEMIEEVVMFTRAFSKGYFRQKWEQDLNRQIRMIIAKLTPRDEKIIRMKYGIDEKKLYSIKEIAIKFGTTQKEIKKHLDSASLRLTPYKILDLLKQIE
ncbi:MAG: TIR domain-containing protein [Desulfobacteraceae bacterium]|nr:TIR domain-containing protein [Desulfobacteraceae bacterium]